jgi:hypothetical protein
VEQIELVTLIATAMGVAWASGINLYAAIFILGYMGYTGAATLPPELQILSTIPVMVAAGFMYCVEFFADKIPGVDTGWDAIHSFIRIPAGAMLASAAIAPLGPEAELAGLIIGGALSAGSHFTKAGGRVLINTSPEPFSNGVTSVAEDVIVIAGLWAALNHPWLFIVALALMVAAFAWLMPKIWRGIKGVFGKIAGYFRSGKA